MTPDITPDMTAVHKSLLFMVILSQQDKICQLAALQYKADNEMESPPTLLVCCVDLRECTTYISMYVVLNPSHHSLSGWDQWAGNKISPQPSVTIQYSVSLSKLWLRYLQHSGYGKAIITTFCK